MPPAKTPKSTGLQSVLTELRGKQDLEIGAFSGFNMKPEGLSTGNLTLDALTGIGGFPKGRITELIGPPSSGKTTAALQAVARCQQAGGIIFYADYERALDPDYCASLGIDVYDESFLYAKPEYFEQGANAFRKLVATGELAMGVFDSVATMVTKHELEAETGAVQVADRAKMMHQFLRQLNPELSRQNVAAIFINHVMELVDATPMGRKLAAQGIKRKTSPGGRALPFYSSLRIEFNQTGNIRTKEFDPLSNEETDQTRQTKVDATIIKNKVADPFRKAELRVRFGRGFSQPYSVLSVLVNHNIVKKTGAWFTFPPELRLDNDDDNAKMQGEDNVLSLMEEHPEWGDLLEKAAYKVIDQLGTDAFESVDGTDLTKNEQAETDFDIGQVSTSELDAAIDYKTGEIK